MSNVLTGKFLSTRLRVAGTRPLYSRQIREIANTSRSREVITQVRRNPSRRDYQKTICRPSRTLRDRNTLLVVAGYAPIFQERPLEDAA
jgi:hypothetical protein